MAQEELKKKPKFGKSSLRSSRGQAPVEEVGVAEAPSGLRRVLAGGLRVGSGILGGIPASAPSIPTTAAAFAIGGIGELLAQLVEGSVGENTLQRMSVEGGLTAVPFGKLIKGGKALSSMVRSGAMSGGGEAMRQLSRGEELDPTGIALGTGLGAVTGGVLSKVTPELKPSAPPVPKFKSIAEIAAAHQDPAEFTKEAAKLIRRERWDLDRVATESKALQGTNPGLANALQDAALGTGSWSGKALEQEIARLEKLGMFDEAQQMRGAAARTKVGTKQLYERGAALDREAARAAKIKERQDALKAAGGRQKQTATETLGATDPKTGLRVAHQTKTVEPEQLSPEAAEAARLLRETGKKKTVLTDTSKEVDPVTGAVTTVTTKTSGRAKKTPAGAAPSGDDVPPSGPAREVYDQWIMLGRTAEEAKALVLAGTRPTPEALARVQQNVREAAEAPLPMSGGAAPETPPSGGVPLAAVPEAPPAGLPVAGAVDEAATRAETMTFQELRDEVTKKAAAGPGAVASAAQPGKTLQDEIVSIVDDAVGGAPSRPLGGATGGSQAAGGLPPQASLEVPPTGPVGAPGGSSTTASVPFMITKRMEAELLAKGITQEQINRMTPAEAHQALQPAAAAASQPVSGLAVAPGASQETEGIARTLLNRQLKDLGYGDDAIAAMPVEQAQSVVTNRTMAPSPVQPAATLKRGGGVNIPDQLSAQEKAEIAKRLTVETYPPELANAMAPLSARYRELEEQIAKLGKPAAGTPAAEQAKALQRQKGTIGMQLGLLGRQAEENGTIPPGASEELTRRINAAIEDANAEKFASGIKVGGKAAPPAEDPFPVPVAANVPPAPVTDLPGVPSGAVRVEEGIPLTSTKLDDVAQGVSPEFAVARASLKERAAAIDADQTLTDVQKAEKFLQLDMEAEALQKQMTPPTGGGTVLGSGFGGLQGMFERHPEIGTRVATAAAGAMLGGAVDPLDDPFASMALGAGAGLSVPTIVNALKKMRVDPNDPDIGPMLQDPNSTKSLSSAVFHLLPHWQRFSYLASLPGLGANAIAGPYGAAFFGAATKALAMDPRGWAALRTLSPTRWMREFWEARGPAMELIRNAEHGDSLARAEITGTALETLHPTARGVIQAPAVWMASGDVASRKLLTQAGFSEQEAREITFTADPFIPFFRTIADLGRSRAAQESPMWGLAFPFRRTPANIAEQAVTRMPGVGFKMQAIREAHGAAAVSTQEQLVQQALGGVMMMGGFALGSAMDPETARLLRRYVTNVAGPYSGLVSLGFAAGQSATRGGQQLNPLEAIQQPGMLREIEMAVPLPTAEPILQMGGAAQALLRGDFEVGDIPRGMVPGVINPNSHWDIGWALAGGLNEVSSASQPRRTGRAKFGKTGLRRQ